MNEEEKEDLINLLIEIVEDRTNVEENIKIMTLYNSEVVIDNTIKSWNLKN